MKQIKLSAAIATHNEESNIGLCLESIKDIVNEIVIVDGQSEDKTVKIAESYGAKVISVPNDPMFHNMKQLSFDKSLGDWILYLDADERVSKSLAKEIQTVIAMDNQDLAQYQKEVLKNKLFKRHQKLLEERDGKIGVEDGEFVAFFFARRNYFLGKYMRYGGTYPDGVIRLFKRGKAYLPCKSVHEQIVVLGKVGWLKNDLLHVDSPTFDRYLKRNNRYIELIVSDLKNDKINKDFFNLIDYMLIKPIRWFLITLIRHKGILDGYQGIIFSFFSALRFPRAYLRYIKRG